jgi:hypothetical protein
METDADPGTDANTESRVIRLKIRMCERLLDGCVPQKQNCLVVSSSKHSAQHELAACRPSAVLTLGIRQPVGRLQTRTDLSRRPPGACSLLPIF